MTLLAATRNPGFYVPASPRSGGTSVSAISLDAALDWALERWTETAGNQLRLGGLEQSLVSILNECAVQGWDGYGAKPISPLALSEARQLLAVIPARLLPDEVLAEPHGGIAFQWNADDGNTLVLSLNGTKTIEFAATYGPIDEDAGKRSFSGLLPAHVLGLISKFH